MLYSTNIRNTEIMDKLMNILYRYQSRMNIPVFDLRGGGNCSTKDKQRNGRVSWIIPSNRGPFNDLNVSNEDNTASLSTHQQPLRGSSQSSLYKVNHNASTRLTIVSKDTKFCKGCGTTKPIHDHWVETGRKVGDKVHLGYIESKVNILCSNCIVYYNQSFRKHELSAELSLHLYRSLPYNKYDFLNKVKSLMIDEALEKKINLPLNFLKHLFQGSKIRYEDTTIQNHDTFEQTKELHWKFHGIKVNDGFNMESIEDCLITTPTSGVIGLLRLPHGDWQMLDSVDYDKERVELFCKNETAFISKGFKFGRSGAAGGVVTPTTDSHSLSKGVSQPLFVPSVDSSKLSVSYINEKTGDPKFFNGVYNDIYMRRICKEEKRYILAMSKAVQHVTVKEMKSRLKCIILSCILNLSEHDVLHSFLHCYYLQSQKVKEDYQMYRERGLDTLESQLCIWASQTGEMRNHEALGAHEDANNCSDIETLSIFRRMTSYNADKKNKNVKSKVTPSDSGVLFLPILGIGIKIEANKGIVHGCLKNTLHVPDPSRNHTNFSRVQGP